MTDPGVPRAPRPHDDDEQPPSEDQITPPSALTRPSSPGDHRKESLDSADAGSAPDVWPVDAHSPNDRSASDRGTDEVCDHGAVFDDDRAPAGDEDQESPDDHDPEGFDVATSVAHQLSGMLPPARLGPRGKRGRRRRRTRLFDEERSGSGPDARDPQAVGAAMEKLVSQRGWRTQLGLRLIVGRWDELVGPTNAAHSRPESYRDRVLVVRAESSTWASALRLLAPQLVAELNRRLGDGSVIRVEVRGPAAPSWRHGHRSVNGRGPRDTYG